LKTVAVEELAGTRRAAVSIAILRSMSK